MTKDSPAATRALALSTYFLSGVLSINLSQFLGTPLRVFDEDWYNAWIAFTKQSFGLLTMNLTHAFAPTKVIVSGDVSVRGQMCQDTDGTLKLDFPHRLVLIANHQIYTDWLYLWWIAYCNKMHGYLYIVLKESLKRIPVLGWGMQLSQFVFLKRNWEQDKPQMAKALQRFNNSVEPMWLLLFPEGTNLASSTRLRSSKWAKSSAIPDCQHVLLPRSTGLCFCLNELKGSVDYLYDCTIAYEGVARGEFAQDIFTLKAGYLEGRPPKSVSMHWRRFATKDIPIDNEVSFGLWLTARWREKDMLIENFHRFGRFPADTGVSKTPRGKVLRGCGRLEVQIRPSHWYEFLQIFAPMGVLAMVLYIFYGDLSQKVWKSVSNEVLQTSTRDVRQVSQTANKRRQLSGSFNLDSLFDRTRQGNTFQQLSLELVQQLQTPQARSVIRRAGMVQQWLENPQKFMVDNLENEAPSKKTFFQKLEEERTTRRISRIEKYHGTFWLDMEKLSMQRSQGNKRLNSGAPNRIQSTARAPATTKVGLIDKRDRRGSFWTALQHEERTRQGANAIRQTQRTSFTPEIHKPKKLLSKKSMPFFSAGEMSTSTKVAKHHEILR